MWKVVELGVCLVVSQLTDSGAGLRARVLCFLASRPWFRDLGCKRPLKKTKEGRMLLAETIVSEDWTA